MSYLGLDIGTTGCKAVVFDDCGRQLSSSRREYQVISPQEGFAELDSERVISGCFDVIREAAGSITEDPVCAIAISSQGEAFTPIGSDGEMLGNAMVSSDSRAAAIASTWTEKFGVEKLYRITGHTAHPMFTLFKLLWLRDNRPDIWKRANAFYCFEDLMHYKLGLEPVVSWPLAGRTMLFDVCKHEWSEEILSAVGLEASRLAKPLASGEIVGKLPHQIARDLGLSDDVTVVAGGHDQPCCALGAGVASTDRAVYGIGTVECITPAFDEPIFSDELMSKNLCTYDFTVRGMYTTVAYSLTGGNLLQWFRDELGQQEVQKASIAGLNAYDILLNEMASEPTSLIVLPYFTPSGTPYFDTETKGAILGLRLTTKRSEILRALLEGVALEMRLNLDILERSGARVRELTATGGGARNRKWIQLKADVLNRPIGIAEVTEAGCMGAAMLACAAVSGEDVTKIAQRWVRLTEVVEPNQQRAEHYNKVFPEYLNLYPMISEFYRKDWRK
jgi:xylulokinase